MLSLTYTQHAAFVLLLEIAENAADDLTDNAIVARDIREAVEIVGSMLDNATMVRASANL